LNHARSYILKNELQDLLTLIASPGLGSAAVRRLLHQYGTASEALLAHPEKNDGAGEKEIRLAERMGIQILPLTSPAYPQRLKELPDAPLVLYVQGELKSVDAQGIAIIGTRQASIYGLEMAERFGRDFAEQGVTVVSGLARGIDTAAHRGALRGGRTVAILGSGLAQIYPQENCALARQISEQGAVLSELSLTTPPHKSHFPRRNRLVSGLTRGTVLIEAPLKSGALITMECARLQKRRLFALPGRADGEHFRGNHALLKRGDAQLVENVQDVLQAYGDLWIPRQRPTGPALDKDEKELLAQFPDEEVSIHALEQITALPVPKLNSLLMSLLLKSAIKEYPGKLYKRSGLVWQKP
jgi:DNA processing protein